jgi:hypothetical protein
MGRAYQNRKESMAKTSDAKARVYSKYGRVIYVCAKEAVKTSQLRVMKVTAQVAVW